MRTAAFIAALVLATLWVAPAGAVTGFVGRLPTVERVTADYTGSSAIETRVRQAAACDVMTRAVELLMGPRYYRAEWQAGEQAARSAFASCVGNRMPEPGSSTFTRRRITSGFGELKRDPRFIAEVRRRYLAPQDLSAVERQEAEWNEMLKMQNAGYVAEREAKDAKAAERKALMFKVLGGCAVALLLGVWGVARGLRPAVLDTSAEPAKLSVAGRSFSLYRTAGVVVDDIGTNSHTTHHPGTDSYDNRGNWIGSTAGYSVTTTDQTVYVADGTGAERALTFRDWNLVARKSHEVAAAWIDGTYLGFRNVTLGSDLIANPALERMFRVNPWFLGLLAIGLAPVAFALTMIGIHRQGVFVAGIVAAALVFVVIWLIRDRTKSRAKAFGRDQLSAFLDRAVTDYRAAAERLLAPHKLS